MSELFSIAKSGTSDETQSGLFESFIRDATGSPITDVRADGNFWATGEKIQLGPLLVSRVVSAPHRASCCGARDHSNYYWCATLQIRGSTRVEQHENAHVLTEGQWSLNHRPWPFRLDHTQYTEQIILAIPRRSLDNEMIALGLQHQGGRYFKEGAMRALSRFLEESLWDIKDTSEQVRAALGNAVLDMFLSVLRDTAVACGRRRSIDLLRMRAIAYLEDNLSDPELSIDQIATGLNCSKRYIHLAFQDAESSVAKTIMEMRLQRAWHDLQNPVLRQHSISSLAYSLGFKDATHFGKAFRERFGVTPGQSRCS